MRSSHGLSLIIASALFAVLGCHSTAAKAADPFGSLTVDQVQALIDTHSASIFDNNNQDRYRKGHLPGATWVSPSEMTASVLPPDKGRTLVFYCANEH